jgi:hypothetical protein
MTDVQPSAEQAREAREQAREQAQQIREQAQRIREEALEAAREAREAAEEAAREARAEAAQDRVIRLPPPPRPPGQEEHTMVPPWQREPPPFPDEVVDIVGMLTFGTAAVLILRPLMRAFANRFERRGTPPTALPPEVTAHMERLEQAIEAVAIEVERISEGQRYTTKLLAERAGKEG